MGLLSPGGVHSHEDAHLRDARTGAARAACRKVAVHAFLDGRDTPPRSAPSEPATRSQARCDALGNARIASVSGRYFAMDRDKRWDRVQLGLGCDRRSAARAHVAADAVAALARRLRARRERRVRRSRPSSARRAPMRDGDAVVFMNFRADRARAADARRSSIPTSTASSARRPEAVALRLPDRVRRQVCRRRVAFAPDDLTHTLGEFLSAQRPDASCASPRPRSTRTSPSSSAAAARTPYPGEERILVPSPKVATYDLQPEMSCPEVTDEAGRGDRARSATTSIVCNIANPDMVGHTGDLGAAIQAARGGRRRDRRDRRGGARRSTARC